MIKIFPKLATVASFFVTFNSGSIDDRASSFRCTEMSLSSPRVSLRLLRSSSSPREDANTDDTQKWSHGPLRSQHPLLRDVWFSITPRSRESSRPSFTGHKTLNIWKSLPGGWMEERRFCQNRFFLFARSSSPRRQVRAIMWVRVRSSPDTPWHTWMFIGLLLVSRFVPSTFRFSFASVACQIRDTPVRDAGNG